MEDKVIEELLARRRAGENLIDYTKYIDVPGKPVKEEGIDWVYDPVETGIADHHRILLENIQKVIEGEIPRMMVFMPPGSAKALEVNTPILTRDGWRRMIDLKVGDYVMAPTGRFVEVQRVSEVFRDRKCYRVSLEDYGDEPVIADEDHYWMIKRPKSGKFTKKVTSEDLHLIIKHGGKPQVQRIMHQRGEWKGHRIPKKSYAFLLGLWLAGGLKDGRLSLNSRKGKLHHWTRTMGLEFIPAGQGMYKCPQLDEMFYILGVDKKVKELPSWVLWEEPYYRHSILKGMMFVYARHYSTKGCVCKRKYITGDVVSLMRSLEIVPDKLMSKGDYRTPESLGEYWSYIRFAREGQGARVGRKIRCHTVKGTYDTVCITVDGGMFCCGKALIPTHNSTYSTVVSPTWAMGKYPNTKIILASYGGDLAKKHGRKARAICKSKEFQNVFNETISEETSAADFWGTTNGSEYMSAGILSGITGNRAHGIIIDDPIRGRADAESDVVCNRTWDAYVDDLRTRLIPGGWEILVQTRWSMGDLAGRLLPDEYEGQTGMLRCKDGRDWFVLNIPAEAEREDDPLGRKIGERLWPEWFSKEHFDGFKGNPRTWSALFQQRPAPEEGTFFKRDWFHMYKSYELPKNLHIYITSDFAVSADKGDFTEHGVWGVDDKGHLWQVGWWHGQSTADVWIRELLHLMEVFKPLCWFGEGGVIRRAIEPFLTKQMQEDHVFCRIEWVNPVSDKATRARGFQAMASQGMVHLKDEQMGHRLVDQLTTFPAGRYDDGVDVCGLIGMVIEQAHKAIIGRGAVKAMTQAERDWLRIRGLADESNAVNVDVFDEVSDEYF